jgi:D-glycero-D-manno-heptose 1,7-bisphosphate phosphatase
MSPASATEPLKLVVLDRDGVINRDSPDFIRSEDEWHPLPGSLEAIAAASAAGWTVVVATNQSGVTRGYLTEAALERIHERMCAAARAAGGRIDAVFFCPHGPDEGCGCRKPAHGLFTRISQRYGRPLAGVPAIGDSARDIEAARRAGARPILVLTGNGPAALEALGHPADLEVYPDLQAAISNLLAEDRR